MLTIHVRAGMPGRQPPARMGLCINHFGRFCLKRQSENGGRGQDGIF